MLANMSQFRKTCLTKALVSLIFFFFLSDSSATTVFPDSDWEERSPESQEVDPAKLNLAMDYIKEKSGVDGTREALVIRNGYLIWKDSADNSHKKHHVWSVTKAFTSAVLGILIDEGKCQLSDFAHTYAPVLKGKYPGATVRHFANFTSGYDALGWKSWGYDPLWPDSGDGSSTPYTPTTPISAPGEAYLYWDDAANMCGYVVTKIAQKSLYKVFTDSVALKIDVNLSEFSWNDFGMVDGILMNGGAGIDYSGVHISARQLARLGHLFLNRGIWKGNQVISQEWVTQATSVQVPTSLKIGFACRSDIEGRGVYGYHWWANGKTPGASQRNLPAAPVGTFYRTGYPHNMIFVIPEWNMVIVRLGLDPSPTGRQGVWNTVLGKIAEAIIPGSTLPDPPENLHVN